MKKNIVILGGGFGGINAALIILKKLREKERDIFDVVLIDKNNFHTFTPLLYELASASYKRSDIENALVPIVKIPFEEIFKKYLKKGQIKILQQEVENINLESKEIVFKNKEFISYEYLILSLGMEANSFGIKNFSSKPFLSLKTFDDACKIKKYLSELSDLNKPKVVVGGGGATGVEFAAEIKNQFPHFEVSVIDASSRILNSFDEKITHIAEKRLEKIGVKIITNEIIKEVRDKSVLLGSGKEIECDIFISALGIKPSEIINNISLPKNKSGRITVNNFLISQSIFAIGDAAVLDEKTPPMAHFAIVEGKIAGLNVLNKIRGKKLKSFKPKNYPYIIPLGGKYAVSKVGSFIIKGFFPWLFKGLVELNYFLTILPFLTALKIWLKGLILFIKHKDLG
jgi:NADH dehydrogenase